MESEDGRGLLLPQVAHSGSWTPARFMEALAHKAGLRSGAYRDPQTRLSVFRAQVFSTSV
jgi:AMMECR1 domain-containing protein